MMFIEDYIVRDLLEIGCAVAIAAAVVIPLLICEIAEEVRRNKKTRKEKNEHE